MCWNSFSGSSRSAISVPNRATPAKFIDLRNRVGGLIGSGRRLFSQFVAEPFGARRLARELADFRPLLLIGGLDPNSRAAPVAEFERDPTRHLMILSLRAGGLGLNLAAASCVFHFDRWWNPAVETQAEDRVHRIGQRRPVQVFAYLCAHTIEERIDEILAEKYALFADLVDDVTTAALGRLDLDSLLRAAAKLSALTSLPSAQWYTQKGDTFNAGRVLYRSG